MKTLHELVRRLAQAEQEHRTMLAPVVAPGRALVRLEGLVLRLSVEPADFSGFGVFSVSGEDAKARLERPASSAERSAYLRLWPRRRLRLLAEQQPGSWLALDSQGLSSVHGLPRVSVLQSVVAASDGVQCWFERSYGERLSEAMAQALEAAVEPPALRLKGLTPLDRQAYGYVYRLRYPLIAVVHPAAPTDDGERLRRALERGGGALRSYTADGDRYHLDWSDAHGVRHFSQVRRSDLSVVSSGICLSGRDADFDLTSLVAVVEASDDWR